MLLTLTTVIIALILVWLSVGTYFLFRTITHYNALIARERGKSLQGTLETVLKEHMFFKKHLDEVVKRCDTIEKESALHIQKIGLLRFNPFKDTGGDQSFILALVDAHNTGIVVSGLYSRSGTRWYAKKVHRGKGVEHELSDEESKAIQIAQVAK